MAKKPNASSGSTLSNIIGLFRGNFDFGKAPESSKTVAYGSSELISASDKTRILGSAARALDGPSRVPATANSVMNLVQSSLSKVGTERLENRKILQLMPEVDKAARLMIASIFSPNDLSRQNISVMVKAEGISNDTNLKLNDKITEFFQNTLNLKTQAPSWVYQFGYESGAAVFAIVPLRSFEKISDESFLGNESFIEKVVKPISEDSLFGFGDSGLTDNMVRQDLMGLESYSSDIIKDSLTEDQFRSVDRRLKELTLDLTKKFIGTETLALTDNPAILQVTQKAKERRDKRTKDKLNHRYRAPAIDPIVSISANNGDKSDDVVGNPILLRLPPESVTVIHTPGDPSDHQGYLVLLDRTGNPITSLTQETQSIATGGNQGQENVIQQTYNSYGLSNGSSAPNVSKETMSQIYTQIVGQHVKNRLGKAGFNQVELGNLDSTFRCLFSRFMQQKQTRILFLPKELVSYMTFEMDPNGYGVSRLDRIKFNLGMKMAVQVSRVMAGIKAAMDKRKIEMTFSDNLMENPENVFQSVLREYVNKQTLSWSIDPNVIQSQIADKSVSIKGNNIPGMETFDIVNEPDTRTGSFDFDPAILEYLDKQIYNGLRVPPATMNSLGEDEYARSVTTTNLFFSMDVSIDQDVVIKCVTDLLRKYARYSSEFRDAIYEILPDLDTKKKTKSKSSTDESNEDLDTTSKNKKTDHQVPENFSIDDLIDAMGISLPKPNVAPSKAQFDSLDGMITAITNMMNSLFPDELAGGNDSLRPIISSLRAKFTASNIKTYLDGSGMSGMAVPDGNFTAEMSEFMNLSTALLNVKVMLDDQVKVTTQPDPALAEQAPIPGY